jgi:hypothetical protein
MSTPIPDLYQVKWYHGTKVKYGIVDKYGPASIQYYNEGRQVIVDDAITPERYVINVDALTDIPMTWNPKDEYTQYVEEQYLIAKGKSDALPPGLHPGKMFHVPVGDGCAYYVVTKVNKKTVDIEWRGYSLDRWVDFRYGVGGREKRDVIEALVRREDAMRALFTREPASA